MSDDNDADIPTLVFSGQYTEALFLKSLLEGSGIHTSLDMPVRGGLDPRLFVPKSHLEDAVAIVEDFLKNGKRTTT